MTQGTSFFFLALASSLIAAGCYFSFREKEILFYKGEKSYRSKDFHQAISLYEKALQKGFYPPLLYYHLGDAYTSERRFEEAANLYKSFLNAHPKNREMRIRLARVLYWEGKLTESSYHYKIANEGLDQ